MCIFMYKYIADIVLYFERYIFILAPLLPKFCQLRFLSPFLYYQFFGDILANYSLWTSCFN